MTDYPQDDIREIVVPRVDMQDLLLGYRVLCKIQHCIDSNEVLALNESEEEQLEGFIQLCEWIFDEYPPKEGETE
jgi:hypothetical protein